jgi:hypothetical protein
MPLRAKPIEAEVTFRCEYVVKLKPAYPVRIRKLKVQFTYTFYLGPRASIGGLFLLPSALPARTSTTTVETPRRVFGYPSEGG